MSSSFRSDNAKLRNVSQYATLERGIVVANFLKTKFSCNSTAHGFQTLFFVSWDNRRNRRTAEADTGRSDRLRRHKDDTKKEAAAIATSCEPKPRFDFASLVLSLLLAAGALSKLRKSLRDRWSETKRPLSSGLEAVFFFRSGACGAFASLSRNRDLNSGPLHYE